MQVEKKQVQIIQSSSEFVHLYFNLIWNAEGSHWEISAQGNKTLNQEWNPWSCELLGKGVWQMVTFKNVFKKFYTIIFVQIP